MYKLMLGHYQSLPLADDAALAAWWEGLPQGPGVLQHLAMQRLVDKMRLTTTEDGALHPEIGNRMLLEGVTGEHKNPGPGPPDPRPHAPNPPEGLSPRPLVACRAAAGGPNPLWLWCKPRAPCHLLGCGPNPRPTGPWLWCKPLAPCPWPACRLVGAEL